MFRRSALRTASVLALLLAIVALTVRVPYVELVPGPVTDTLGKRSDGVPIITVQGHPTYPTSGTLDLTTVGVRGGPPGPLTLGQAVVGWVAPHEAVLPEEVVYPPSESQQKIEQQNTQEMVNSQEHAITAALSALHIPFTTQVTVAAVVPGTPADGRLRAGDVITSVDGAAVTSQEQLQQLIRAHRPGTEVRLGIVRAGAAKTLAVPTARDPQDPSHAVVGIVVGVKHTFPFKVSINLKDVGGPSAGLMFTLGIIDKLTPGALNGGRHVAGTGTMADNGVVGPIGGIQQKVVAARRAGATVFLTPVDNCAAAKAARPAGLELVKVGTLHDALSRLAALVAGRAVPTC